MYKGGDRTMTNTTKSPIYCLRIDQDRGIDGRPTTITWYVVRRRTVKARKK